MRKSIRERVRKELTSKKREIYKKRKDVSENEYVQRKNIFSLTFG